MHCPLFPTLRLKQKEWGIDTQDKRCLSLTDGLGMGRQLSLSRCEINYFWEKIHAPCGYSHTGTHVHTPCMANHLGILARPLRSPRLPAQELRQRGCQGGVSVAWGAPPPAWSPAGVWGAWAPAQRASVGTAESGLCGQAAKIVQHGLPEGVAGCPGREGKLSLKIPEVSLSSAPLYPLTHLSSSSSCARVGTWQC